MNDIFMHLGYLSAVFLALVFVLSVDTIIDFAGEYCGYIKRAVQGFIQSIKG